MKGSFLVVLCLWLAASACGPSGPMRADVTAGSMPEGGNFTGVWFSPEYGRMDVVQTGSSVVGEYTKDERHGRIEGTVRGDLLRFSWRETREIVRGRPLTTHGLGYFRYSLGDNGEHRIRGEWGIDDNEIGGGPWTGVKSARMRPHLSTDTGRRADDNSPVQDRGVVGSEGQGSDSDL